MFEALVLALAMDATAVAAARGAAGIRRSGAWTLAIAFGGFQAGMAALGWVVGAGAARWVAAWDHWLVFALLALIGGKMIVEGWRQSPETDSSPAALSLGTVVLLAIATSIDALAAGVTLPLLGAPIGVSLALIGGATLILSLAGALGGKALGSRVGEKLTILGGVALVAIGAKTLIEHLTS
jgi:manganese efflux pump family protein